MVVMVAAIAVMATWNDQQTTPGDPQVESSGKNSSAELRQALQSISTAVLDSLSRSDHSCSQVCAEVLQPACITECRRRRLPNLVCRMVCYSSTVMCCRCSTSCHRPFQVCFTACAESDTWCKDCCIDEVNKCCDDDMVTTQEKEENVDGEVRHQSD
ncbi:uncharacterized protein LOC123520076 isoform X2 [Portunus trituberculatus]|uniref:Uncharacterized protein n=2 Tax=Portunus trituberculatus TaxID=210409 RepID=A0A5B7HH47_PORTR|nr:uncharacterized protein LOC123520076 isoform X2 [Portunus trituberculatus]MPC72161.1 hypothetical protein [Portunus trituberculatus]